MNIEHLPRISCLMVTQEGRLGLAATAASQFQQQQWKNKELVVVCDGNRTFCDELEKRLRELVENVCFVFVDEALSLGKLRNISVDNSGGDIICQWDDDDQYHPLRLSIQANHLITENLDFCCLSEQLHFFADMNEIFWMDWTRNHLGHSYGMDIQQVAIPGTLLAWRNQMIEYEDASLGEDSYLLKSAKPSRSIGVLQGLGWCHMYVYHGTNSFDRQHHDNITQLYYRRLSLKEIEARVKDDFPGADENLNLPKLLEPYQFADPTDIKFRTSDSIEKI